MVGLEYAEVDRAIVILKTTEAFNEISESLTLSNLQRSRIHVLVLVEGSAAFSVTYDGKYVDFITIPTRGMSFHESQTDTRINVKLEYTSPSNAIIEGTINFAINFHPLSASAEDHSAIVTFQIFPLGIDIVGAKRLGTNAIQSQRLQVSSHGSPISSTSMKV